MRKKLISTLITALCLLCFAACSDKSTEQTGDNNATVNETNTVSNKNDETENDIQGDKISDGSTDSTINDSKSDNSTDNNSNNTSDKQSDTTSQDFDKTPVEGTYKVHITDTNGNPVEGVKVQFCSDVECTTAKTNIDGIAEFTAAKGKYEIHMLKVPEGYEEDETIYETGDSFGTVEITLNLISENNSDIDNVDVTENSDDFDEWFSIDYTNDTGLYYNASGLYRSKDYTITTTGSYLMNMSEPFVWVTTFCYIPVKLELADQFFDYVNNEWMSAYYAGDDIPEPPYDGWDKWDEMYSNLFDIFAISNDAGEEELKEFLWNYQSWVPNEFVEIGKTEDVTFFMAENYYATENRELLKETLSEKDYSDFISLLDNKQDMIDSLSFYVPDKPYHLNVGNVISFEWPDMDDNMMSSADIFKDYKVTMINLWGTYCGPCKMELPELGQMAEELKSQGIQIIGVCNDAYNDENVALAKQLFDENGCTYLSLKGQDNIYDVLPVSAVPTTFFVDSEGRMLVEPITGAYIDGYKAALEECLKIVGE